MALSPLQDFGRELARVAHSVIALDQFTGVVEADDDKTPSNRRAIDAVAKGGQRGRGEIILKESPRRGPPSWGPQCFFFFQRQASSPAATTTGRIPNWDRQPARLSVAYFFSGFITNQ